MQQQLVIQYYLYLGALVKWSSNDNPRAQTNERGKHRTRSEIPFNEAFRDVFLLRMGASLHTSCITFIF